MKNIFPVLMLLGLLSVVFAQKSAFRPMLNAAEKQHIESGDVLLREVNTDQEKGQTIEAIGRMQVSGPELVQVLMDYESYPEFMSAVASIEIIAETQQRSTLNYSLTPILGISKKYRLDIWLEQPDSLVWKIEWTMVKWPGLEPSKTIGDTQGYWLIIEESENQVLVQYKVYSDPGYIPFGLGGIADALGTESVEEVFVETRNHVELIFSP